MYGITGQVHIDLQALRQNYRILQDKVGVQTAVSAVVKANGYGLGAVQIVGALKQEGCQHFFVANLQEAMDIRQHYSDVQIMIFNGYYEGFSDLYSRFNLIPVLDDLSEIEGYRRLAKRVDRLLPTVLHLNTGMNRLGMDAKEIDQLASDTSLLEGLDVQMVMSHLACADQPNHPLNKQQLDAFKAASEKFAKPMKVLANSSGIFLGAEYHFDCVRPGMALYGLNPTPYADNPMRPVVRVDFPVICERCVDASALIGYGATHEFEGNAAVVTVAAGYADGVPRALSNNGQLYWQGIACPIVGRVSMDMLSVDVSKVPAAQRPKMSDRLEYIGPHQSAADIGALCDGSFDYEILTSLGSRFERVYGS